MFSADGTKLAFTSTSPNLTANSNALTQNIYVADLKTGAVTLVSAGQGNWENASSPSFSADGNKLVFTSGSDALTANDKNHQPDVFVKDLTTGTVTLVSTDSQGNALALGPTMPRFPRTAPRSFSAAPILRCPGTHPVKGCI